MFSLTASSVALALVLSRSARAQSSVAELVSQLRLAPAENDRFSLLNGTDLLFNFNEPPSSVGVTTGYAGHTVAATSENFPAIIGQGVSMTIGYLGPCGMNSPHTHPRATEINFSLNNTLTGGVLVENGARFATIPIAPGSATVFPTGAIHFEFNDNCTPAMFIASFNGEDPGVDQVAQRFFGLPPDIVGATLGGLGVEEVAGLEALIPDNVALGPDACLARCGLTRDNQPTAQRQPRVAANAFPVGIEVVYPFGSTGEASETEGESEEPTTSAAEGAEPEATPMAYEPGSESEASTSVYPYPSASATESYAPEASAAPEESAVPEASAAPEGEESPSTSAAVEAAAPTKTYTGPGLEISGTTWTAPTGVPTSGEGQSSEPVMGEGSEPMTGEGEGEAEGEGEGEGEGAGESEGAGENEGAGAASGEGEGAALGEAEGEGDGQTITIIIEAPGESPAYGEEGSRYPESNAETTLTTSAYESVESAVARLL